MTTRATQFRLQIAEKSVGSLSLLALLRWAPVVIFLWFGGVKFIAYEANGIAPFIVNSPIMSWLHALFGVQGASDVIGVEIIDCCGSYPRGLSPFFLHWERRGPL
jgi:hypothetical protein